jgi:hypothetical protein
MAYSFIFGGNTKETPESIKQKRELAMAILGASRAPRNVGEGLNALGDGIVAGVMNHRANRAENEGRSTASDLFNRIIGQAPNVSAPRAGGNASAAPAPASSGSVNMSGNDIYSGFMDTVDNSITNPFGLAAVAATGKAESGFSPGNANRSWSDPSQSGDPGTAGGIMSWRGPRLANLQAYAASKGEQGNGSPQTQAEFLLQEDPNLITALNNAKSAEEAQSIINNAWKFAGYDKPGGESARRLGYANAYLPNFQGQGQQVASLDPSIGVPGSRPQANAPTAPAPAATPSLTDEAAEFRQTPEYRAQFPGMQQPAQAPTAAPPQQVAQSPQQMPQVAPLAGVDPQLLQALANPFLAPEERAVLETMYQQQMQQQQAAREQQIWLQRQQYETEQKRSDPGYQLGLEKTRAEVKNLQTPEYRDLTPEERKAAGIPETDPRPYQRSRGGKLDAVGGTGQTINIGGEIEARKQAAEMMGLKPDDPRYMGYVLNGEVPKESQQELTATDKKAKWAAEDELPVIDNTISSLQQARDLNRKTFTGTGAGLLGTIGTNVPGASLFIDRDTAAATSEFNKLMSMEAIQSMAQTLKGATTDSELARFVDILADPSTDPDIRERTIDRMLTLANRVKDVKTNRINELSGSKGQKPVQAPAGGQNIDDLLKKYGAQ